MAQEDKIRVLIVDDVAETRENIRKLLQFDATVEVVGASRNGLEGVEMAIEAQPDVVLMDINMPDMDGISATEAIRKKVPFTQIVILSVQGDSNYMRRAMLAGARDFLTKPIDIDELTAAIHRAGRVARTEREKLATGGYTGKAGDGKGSGTLMPGDQGHVITVFSPKGGTGKTTSAVNTAAALVHKGKQVLLIDLERGDWPAHPSLRVIPISRYCPNSDESPATLVRVRLTSDMPSGFLFSVPLKITSSILSPRRCLALCSPSTHRMASEILLFPQPLGPTTAVTPGWKVTVVLSAKDLKPIISRDLSCIGLLWGIQK